MNVGGRLMDINRPLVMGILNITPDSFYEGSRCGTDNQIIVKRIEKMIADGVDIIDVGGYSSRPGAADISAEEELRRLETGIKAVRKISQDMIISVDTFRADVARKCVSEWGAHIINDISGGNLDSMMFQTVADLHVPYILMHMRGTPCDMSSLCNYGADGVLAGVMIELGRRVDILRSMGVCDIIIDPGFGFSKNLEQNFILLDKLEEFHSFGLPLLVGVSRKSMICKVLGVRPADALNGTTVLNTIALLRGAHILRVHDVHEAVEAVKLVGATTGGWKWTQNDILIKRNV